MKFLKLVTFTFFALFCFISLSSCGWLIDRDPDVFINSISDDPTTLNPILATDVNSSSVNRYIYESLLDRDNKTLELKAKIAKRWEVSADHLSYTFWIRDDVKWHDGEPLTVDDVLYTFEKIRDPKVDAAQLKNYFRDVKTVEKVGSDAVRFVYKYPYFKALEVIGGLSIIPKHVFDDGSDFNSHKAGRAPIGTGPYKFVEWKTGQSIKLIKNEEYWDKKPAIAGIIFKIIPDQMVGFWMLKKGSLDSAGLRAIQWTRQTEGESFQKKFTKHRFYLPNYFFIAWNAKKPMFSDRRVRIAMTMLVNRQKILDKVFFGQGEVVTNDFYRYGPNYDESIEPYPYDPAGAAKLFDEAGWIDTDGDGIRDRDGVPFKFSYLTASGSRAAVSIGLFLREELSKVGIEMEIVQLEWATLSGLIGKRDYDCATFGWSTALVEDPYQVWHSSQIEAGSNFVGFSNAEGDAIIEKARREFDPNKRKELYRRFAEILNYEEPYTFLFTIPTLTAVAKRFTNVETYRLGMDMLEWGVGPWPKLVEF